MKKYIDKEEAIVALEQYKQYQAIGVIEDMPFLDNLVPNDYVNGWNDGRDCAFNMICDLIDRITDTDGLCKSENIKMMIDVFRLEVQKNKMCKLR